jgi:hypothetical protein
LEFDDEEVEKLLDVVEEALKRLFGNGEVLARTHAGG